MKKIITACLCMLLVAAMAVTVFAAGASFSMSASDKTLYRGDTVTLSVSVSCSEIATSYGLMLSYDNAVFELVDGACTVPGALVSSFNNGFAFMFQAPTAYSGQVGTVTLKVKDTAPFGSYTVSGSASVKNGSTTVSASGSSVALTVACQHSYGSWAQIDDTNHGKTCASCQDVQTEVHKWDNGKVSKPATCKEDGVKTYTCSVCKATKTEAVAKTDDHTFGNLTAVNDSQHKDTCSVCQKEITEAHKWDSGKVTKPATCKEEGEKEYTCTGCNYGKKEKIARTDNHSYGAWQNLDENNHQHACSVCQKEETAAHNWNKGVVTKKPTCKEEGEKTYTCTGCGAAKKEVLPVSQTHSWDKWAKTDAETHKRQCTVCQEEETGTHSYATSWSKDKNEHWHECSVCKDKKDAQAHVPGPEATETTAQTCTTCGYVIKAALAHTHDYADAWTTDEVGHWHTCSGCEEKGSYADHDFENACDPDCSICGYTRETDHTYGDAWASDEANHWQECAGCGLKAEEAAHEPGAEATADTAQTCTICDYELAPAQGIEETEPTETVENTTQDNDQESNFIWWIIIAAIIAVGGVVVFFIIKKK